MDVLVPAGQGHKVKEKTVILKDGKPHVIELKLDLPSGTGRGILEELEGGLKKVNDYDPEKVQKEFGRLADLCGMRWP